ncbi:MAG: HAD family hydrolase [Alphaproteobacteria bacterium]|nr:HAD family hydrolase [Alphaproteobacteria bacterium]
MDISDSNPFRQDPKVVIFDLCGTLMDSKKIDHDAINYTLSYYKKDCWEITRLKKDKSKSMKENFPIFFGDQAQEAYNMYINYLVDNMKDIHFFDDASAHLNLLKNYNIKTAIVTNRDSLFVSSLDSHQDFLTNIKPFIDTVVTADEAGVTKPSAKIIDYTLTKLSLSHLKSQQDVVFIRDAYADMQVAINYPAIPILLTATTADITEDFLKRNYANIYQAKSHKKILNSFKQFKERERMIRSFYSMSKKAKEINNFDKDSRGPEAQVNRSKSLEKINLIQHKYTALDIVQSLYQFKKRR